MSQRLSKEPSPEGDIGQTSIDSQARRDVTPRDSRATVRWLTPVLAVRLSRACFDRLLDQGSIAAYKLTANAAGILAQRLQATERWIDNMLQERQDNEIAASWREFRHRVGIGHSLAEYGPVGSVTPGGS